MAVTFEGYERRIDQIMPVLNKYGIKAVRLMYDGDYLKEMIKEYIAGNSMFK